MASDTPIIMPLGESAVVVEFGSAISTELNQQAVAFAVHINANQFAGFVEAVPAYASTSVFYDLAKVVREFACFANGFEAVRSMLLDELSKVTSTINDAENVVEIPAQFGGDGGPDLENVASECGIDISNVIEIFLSRTYRVYMVGFLPSFAYMGDVDERIQVSRRDQPRLKVPKGSIGIAGPQTGVYPLETPGGWQLIGRTATEFFRPHDVAPSLLNPGDRVKFVPV